MNQQTSATADGGRTHAQIQREEEALKPGRDFAEAIVDGALKAKRNAQYVATAMGVMAVAGWIGFAFIASRPVPPPTMVMVDRQTGEAWVAGVLTDSTVPKLSVLDQHWAQRFVLACESYHYQFLQRDYDQCRRMSSPEVFKDYDKNFHGSDAKQEKMGERLDESINVISVRASANAKPGEPAELVVTYDKTILMDGHPTAERPTRYLKSCQYEYHPQAMAKPLDRLENPMGFICVHSSTDAEVGVSTPPTTTAQAATTRGAGGQK